MPTFSVLLYWAATRNWCIMKHCYSGEISSRFVIVLAVVSCSHDWISGSVLEVTIRPGDNITLYCDCKASTGEYMVWYRNCSHENQPSLVLKSKVGLGLVKIFPRFQLWETILLSPMICWSRTSLIWMRASTIVELKRRRWWMKNALLPQIFTHMATSQQGS